MSMCLVTGKDESTAPKQSRPSQRETTQTADSAVSSKVAPRAFQHGAFCRA